MLALSPVEGRGLVTGPINIKIGAPVASYRIEILSFYGITSVTVQQLMGHKRAQDTQWRLCWTLAALRLRVRLTTQWKGNNDS